MSVVAVNVGVGVPLPANGRIQVRVDRYLLPSTVSRQSFALTEASGAPIGANYVVSYDPVTLTVTLAADSGRPWVVPGQPYKLRLPVADADPQGFGLRAIDGSPLAPGTLRDVSFVVSKDSAPEAEVTDPRIDFCRDVQPVLTAKCGGKLCHGSSAETAAAGLMLGTFGDVQATATGRVAHGSATGARRSLPNDPGSVFGVDMPLVDKGNAANSWLLYKVLLAAPPASPIAGDLACPSAGKRTQDPPVAIARPATSPDAVEQAILNDYVLGREMPYPSTGPADYRTQPLSFAERVRLRLWIDQGAVGESCAACSEPVAEVDGGAPDSGASDAGDGGLPVPSDAGTD